MSTFKIRPNHERIFNFAQHLNVEDVGEETVIVVDEATGEVSEERRVVSSSLPPKPQKENKFIGFAMRKKNKVSFM